MGAAQLRAARAAARRSKAHETFTAAHSTSPSEPPVFLSPLTVQRGAAWGGRKFFCCRFFFFFFNPESAGGDGDALLPRASHALNNIWDEREGEDRGPRGEVVKWPIFDFRATGCSEQASGWVCRAFLYGVIQFRDGDGAGIFAGAYLEFEILRRR